MSVTGTDPLPLPELAQREIGLSVPYPPSFIDRFTDFIQRLPIHYGLTYFLLFLAETALFLVISWDDGWLPAYGFDPIVVMFPMWLWAPLAFVTYLDSLARRALSEFKPLLDISPETRQRLEYEFTTMPAGSVLLSAFAWAGVYLLFWFLAWGQAVALYDPGPLGTRVFFVAGFCSFFLGSAIYYHSIRQLRLVSRTVKIVSRFDLFHLEPVYAFSVLTSRTGLCWIFLLTLTLLVSPLEVGGITQLSTLVLQIALAMAAFLLPLRIVNLRLLSEKRRQLEALDQRMKATLARLHERIDQNSYQEISLLNDALKGLTTEREILNGISTWPWRPGLFAGFFSLVVLPVVLFLIQTALGRLLAP